MRIVPQRRSAAAYDDAQAVERLRDSAQDCCDRAAKERVLPGGGGVGDGGQETNAHGDSGDDDNQLPHSFFLYHV